MLYRRTLLQAVIAGVGLAGFPYLSAAGLPRNLKEELDDSDLIYLTSIQSNGRESRCQSEIWYVWDGSDIYVCTDTNAWRVKAVAKGLNRSRIWVGDLGNWQRTDGEYKNLPRIEALASIVTDESVHSMALDRFGSKYPFGWIKYGSIFRDGLASGSRTLLKYQPVAT